MLRSLNFSFNGDIHCFFLLQTSNSAIGFTGFVYQCRSVLENTKVKVHFCRTMFVDIADTTVPILIYV